MYGERRPEFDPNQFFDNLKQWWERFTSKLPGGGNSGGGLAIGAIVGVVLLIWLAFGVYQVQPNEQAAIQTFGEFQGITTPGLRWHWPPPIGKVQKESVTETKTMELGYRSGQNIGVPRESLMITGDLNIVNVELAVQYRISDIRSYLFNLDDPGDPERGIPAGRPDGRTLRDAAEAALRQVVGQRSIDDVLTRERERVQADTVLKLQELMNEYNTGINILSIQLQEVTPPASVREAFDDVVSARSEQETRINQADAYEQDQLPRALGAAQQTIQAAQAFRAARVSRAQGEADRFVAILEAYDASQEVTRQRLYLETLESVLPGASVFIFDEEAGSGVLQQLQLNPNTSPATGGGN